MAVSQRNSKVVYDALKKCGVGLVSALPETWLVHLIRLADDDPEMILVRLAKEEEGDQFTRTPDAKERLMLSPDSRPQALVGNDMWASRRMARNGVLGSAEAATVGSVYSYEARDLADGSGVIEGRRLPISDDIGSQLLKRIWHSRSRTPASGSEAGLGSPTPHQRARHRVRDTIRSETRRRTCGNFW